MNPARAMLNVIDLNAETSTADQDQPVMLQCPQCANGTPPCDKTWSVINQISINLLELYSKAINSAIVFQYLVHSNSSAELVYISDLSAAFNPTLGETPVFPSDFDPADLETVWLILRKARASIWEYEFNTKSDEWLALSAIPKRELNGSTLWNGRLINVSERKKRHDDITSLAYTDALTGLGNRHQLSVVFEANQRQRSYSGLLMIDLDRLKQVNDFQGHAAGDCLLIRAAARIKNAIREADYVFRLGGDEFLVLIRDIGPKKTEAIEIIKFVAEKILMTLAAPYQLDFIQHNGITSVPYLSSASIGLTIFSHCASQAEATAQADAALLRAKKEGRNCLRFYNEK